ncbi:vacuolar cation/proton exchanger 1a-like isoform X1 [Zingiber officinale]|nr:vacuolar cation/proton exchanger 1a-like isoform X1 [Zingiber officinale]XP_042444621.1 vacuolar cation/proton exchanger 1a-like isoform X1 [Zingiber officinale]
MGSTAGHGEAALEAGNALKFGGGGRGKEKEKEVQHGWRTAHNMSSSSLRKKSDLSLVLKMRWGLARDLLANLQEIFLGTKLFILFPAIPLAVAANYFHFGREWLFALSLLGLTPLAERVSFLTEQIAFYTGPTVGGLFNATCGNVTELIIALFALQKRKIEVVKCSLVGSILSNLLFVLGTSLFFGGLANLRMEQLFERKQVDVNTGLLLFGALCHILMLLLRYPINSGDKTVDSTASSMILALSRACSIIMLLGYLAYLFFQLKTHRRLFKSQEEKEDDANDDVVTEDKPVIGFASAMVWLAAMAIMISLLSEYVVETIEAVSHSWGLSVSFISIILLPIVGNAAEHAGAIIFAFKNKLDITLGVSLGSATQISMLVVPLCVIVAWITGIKMDLDLNLLETGSLIMAILVIAFTLQDGTSHYLKGLVPLLCYLAIAACFFVFKSPLEHQPTSSITRTAAVTVA